MSTAAPRVLVVDDNALTVELVGFVLGQAGFDLQTDRKSVV